MGGFKELNGIVYESTPQLYESIAAIELLSNVRQKNA